MKTITTHVINLSILILVSFSSLHLQAQVQTARYISMGSNTKGFYEYLPQGYSSGTSTYPVIIFLHGSGEVGDGSTSQLPRMLNTGLPALIQQGKFPVSFTVNSKTYKFIVISPQFVQWPKSPQIDSVLNYVLRNYRVDSKKVYVTGLSMGGGATWEYVADVALYNKRISAIVPIAGASWPDVGRSNRIADALLPVWATHNDGDPSVPVTYTNTYIQNIKARNANAPVKKTIFSSTSHDAWTKTYDPAYKENTLNVYEWMLQYDTRVTTPANQLPVSNAGTDASINLPANSVVLNGKSSYDPDGTIATYAWTKTSGPTQYTFSSTSSNNPTVSNLLAGQYIFRLTVTDNKGAVAYDDVVVTVNATAPAGTKQINVNIYNGTLPYNNTQWNNWSFGTATTANLTSSSFKYSDGSASTITTKISTSGSMVDNGSSYGSGMAPAEVLRYASYSTATRTLTFSGLSSSQKYTLDLYASRNTNSSSSTVFTVNSTSQTIATYNNKSIKATFSNLAPNAQNQLVVTIAAAGSYNYINGFTLSQSSGTGKIASTANETLSSISSVTNNGELLNKSSLSVSPNPVNERFELSLRNGYKGEFIVQIIDANGAIRQQFKSVKEYEKISRTYYISRKLGKGDYTVRVMQGGVAQSIKIVKLN